MTSVCYTSIWGIIQFECLQLKASLQPPYFYKIKAGILCLAPIQKEDVKSQLESFCIQTLTATDYALSELSLLEAVWKNPPVASFPCAFLKAPCRIPR